MAYAGKLTYKTELDTSGVQKAGSTIKSIIAGLGITKMISMAMSEITNSIDGAIARYDTLNNFSKVMSNLGIASEEADKSIKKMSDKLSGLPTTLDQGARAVQRFTSKNGDVEKSTDLFLALNNAILAGGASSEIQASALEQLSQSYAKGKPDMMEWRTAMMAMPAQLKQVAKAMGYVNADELGESLRNGTVSMDEFMDAIIKLNDEGIDGLNNFREQAKAGTQGIATSITNMKTQIVKGVTDIITALNKSFEKTRFGSLANFIAKAGDKIKLGLNEIAKLISGEITADEFGKSASSMINKFIQTINNELPNVVNKGADVISNFIIGFSQNIPNVIVSATNLVITLANTIVDNSDKILNAGIELLSKLGEGLILSLPKISEAIDKLADFIVIKLEDPKFIERLAEVGTKIIISMAIGMIKSLPNLLNARNKIIGEFNSKLLSWPNTFKQIGKNIVNGIWQGIINATGQFGRNLDNWASGIVSRITKKLKIKSPSQVLRDKVGQWIPKGIAVGIDANTDSIEDSINDMYKEMNRTIKMENSKMNFDVISGDVYNKSFFQTPVAINVQADVEMDSQKVGRLVTPSVTRTIKNGGGI